MKILDLEIITCLLHSAVRIDDYVCGKLLGNKHLYETYAFVELRCSNLLVSLTLCI
jgi:hypothetical protein